MAHKLGPGRTHAGWTASQNAPQCVAAERRMCEPNSTAWSVIRMLKSPRAAHGMVLPLAISVLLPELPAPVYVPSSFQIYKASELRRINLINDFCLGGALSALVGFRATIHPSSTQLAQETCNSLSFRKMQAFS